MLTIRTQQIEAFSLASERECTAAIARHLRTCLPELQEQQDRILIQAVQEAIQSARSFGLNSPKHFAKFAALRIVMGSDFLDRPGMAWARPMLADPEVTDPGARLDRLYQRCVWKLQVQARNRRTLADARVPSEWIAGKPDEPGTSQG